MSIETQPVPRLVFDHVEVEGYVGVDCKIGLHDDCPGGWPIHSFCGTPCACSCHDAPGSES